MLSKDIVDRGARASRDDEWSLLLVRLFGLGLHLFWHRLAVFHYDGAPCHTKDVSAGLHTRRLCNRLAGTASSPQTADRQSARAEMASSCPKRMRENVKPAERRTAVSKIATSV